MRIVVTGATGNVGTSVVRALAGDPAVREIVGIARRAPTAWDPPRTRFVAADVTTDDLVPLFAGADAVIHLAWVIQPSHDEAAQARVNVDGSRRVFEAAAAAGVGALVHASSVGVYSPGAGPVDESWPREGIATSAYSRHKVLTERMLDAYEDRLRVVRLRPGLIFKGEAAPAIARYFSGRVPPGRLIPRRIPLLPLPRGLAVQAVHSDDVAAAYRIAAVNRTVHGAFNIAADPVLDHAAFARIFHARVIPVPPRIVRALAALSWRARLQPTSPGWLDMGLRAPLLDTRRARSELGWEPLHDAVATLLDLLDGLRGGGGAPTPPLRAP